MNLHSSAVKEMLLNLPVDRLEPFNILHDVIVKNLPKRTEPDINTMSA